MPPSFLAGLIRRLGLEEAARRFSYTPGLPPGLDPARVDELLRARGAGHLARARSRHTSGWKASGAHRVVLRSSSGEHLSVIYKSARYTDLEIPALEGLPITPGPGEYLVYTHAEGELAAFLPRVYLAQELEPAARYDYLLEDLSARHHTCVGAAERRRACAAIPELQRALATLASGGAADHLPRFDRTFDRRLLPYARAALTSFQALRPEPAVGDLLARWDDLARHFDASSASAHGSQTLVLVHGDFNTSNVLVNRDALKAVDWEWAGWGLPHTDLATMLEGAPPALEEECLERFHTTLAARSLAEDRRLHAHVRLQRALLNASFVARQYERTAPNAPSWLPRFVATASAAALAEVGRGRLRP